MAAEFYITFEDDDWIKNNKKLLEEFISKMEIFVEIKENEYRLKQNNTKNYDVRLIINNDNSILLEINYHPKIIEYELKKLFSWMREKANIFIKDEDGELSNW